ncbi:hypothetical protein TSUD_368920 [Trifolium subterraneum]|uniref:Uncharacterized protein n=1 Tax=Trifolium subterraneum TaxID=3900 RepID=A0A2Z6PEY0_TRISU|nr:hypothetical protein TSUD_368920 [Trifolium subterraneum]
MKYPYTPVYVHVLSAHFRAYRQALEKLQLDNAYLFLTRGEREEPGWTKEVWNSFIPTRMSILVWQLFQNRDCLQRKI